MKRHGSTRLPGRTWGFLRFVAVFGWEFIGACLEVAGVVLFRRIADLKPGFITFPVPDLTPFEAFFFSYCITLTPGTTTADYNPKAQHMIVHSIGLHTEQEVRDNIERRLLRPILAFTR